MSAVSCSSIISIPTRIRGIREVASAMARIGAAVLAYKLLDCACITDMVFRLVKATNNSAIAGMATAIANIHLRENLLMIMSRTYRSEKRVC
ncbi:Uncharacterised protein [Vibrio cholerae]|nr:Uncharacterised protein [Vibrio cholerae]CSI71142.1 Uncharacterised protein [Vibrio cholerae]